MKLSEAMIWALECDKGSGIQVYCGPSDREKVKRDFHEIFCKEWDAAVDHVKKQSGDVPRHVYPAETTDTEYGFLISLEPLDIRFGINEDCNLDFGTAAIEKTMRKLKEAYPEVEYVGYIGFPWSDMHGGDTVEFMLVSSGAKEQEDEPLDYMGEKLNGLCADVPEKQDGQYISGTFWEKLQSNLEGADEEMYIAVVEDFLSFSSWISRDRLRDAISFVMSVAEDDDEDILEVLGEKYEDLL